MKKRKFNLLLEIATLCLCIAAIAFGVYSAKSASLNVSGTIGFEAHNVKATIFAQIKGDGVTGNTASADGTPRTDYATIGNTVTLTGTETEANKPALALNQFYFSDMGESGNPADIYLKISVTNNSAFNIKVYFDVPNITGVTATIGEDSSSYVKLGTTNSDKSGDIVLKLSLNANDSGDYGNLTTENNLNLTMHLEKYEDYYVKSITESVYNGSAFADVTTNRLCTQLGHGTKEDLNSAEFKQLEWYAFAVKGLDTGKGYMYNNAFYKNGTENGTLEDRWYTLYGVDVNNDITITVGSENVSLKGHQLWFIQQYTVGGGYYTKGANDNFATGKMFNANLSQTPASTYANGTTYQSDIFKYLNNDTSNKCDSRTSNNTFILDTGISYDKHYQKTISADTNKRAVSETDKTKKGGSTQITITNNFTSTFWLLNYTELGLAYNKSLGQSNYGYFVKNFSIGKTDGVEADNTVCGAKWWLRSPFASHGSYALCVNHEGKFGTIDAGNSPVGVRAAFQIQI